MVDRPSMLLVEPEDLGSAPLSAAFEACGHSKTFWIAQGLGAALEYLRGEGDYANRSRFPLPSLVLLNEADEEANLKLLAWIRQQPKLRRIPVLLLSGNDQPEYSRQAYDLGTSSLLRRPSDPGEMRRIAELIWSYWFNLNQRPEIS